MPSPERRSTRVAVVAGDDHVAARVAERLERERSELDAAVTTPEDVLSGVADIDCVVSGVDLGSTDGLSLLEAVRQRRPALPFILFPERGSETLASEAIAADVTDYVPRGTGEDRIDVLANRVVNAVRQHEAERRTAELDRIHDVLWAIDGALVRANTVDEMAQSVCDILATSDPYLFAWFGEYDEEVHSLDPIAYAGVGEGFLDVIPVGGGERLPEEGPGPRAIETGSLQVAQNVDRSPGFDEYLEEVDERGFRSVATVPIAEGESVVGLLAIYADRRHAFDEVERELLTSIGYAIAAIRAETDLRRFREGVDHAGHAICLTAPDGEIEYVNPAFVEQTGYAAGEVVGERLSEIQDVGPEAVTEPNDAISREMTWDREFLATRRSGETYYAEQTIAPIVGEGGLDGFVVVQADTTSRREREEALRTETETLAGLFQTSPIGIVVLDPDGTIQRANERAAALMALERSELVGKAYDASDWAFVDEDGDAVPDEQNPFLIVADRAEPLYDYEVGLSLGGPGPIWLSINGAPLFDPEGDLERLVFTFDDVTAERRAREDLRETNQTLSAVIEAAPVAIVARDPDAGVTIWNEGAERIFGWSAEAVLGETDPPFVPEDRREEFLEHERRVREGERIAGVEVVRVRKDGERRSLSLSVAPIQDPSGAVSRTLSVFVDITERKEREKALRSFKQGVEYAAHSIYMTDVDGVIEYVNPAFVEQTGYAREEAIGETPAILNSGVHEESFFREMWTTLLDGRVWVHEIVNERTDGTHYYVDQSIAPVFDDDGAIERFVAVNRDVTDRKRYEQRLEHQNERLEEFASVVSHDLRNPLNVASGHLQLLDDDSEHAGAIERSLDRMETIIEDVLTLAREGRTVEETEPVDVGTLACEAWGHVDTPDATLAVQSPPTVAADPQRLLRVLENIFRNAVEHAGPAVTVRVGTCEGGFYVEDDGPGIDPDVRERVFESGYTDSASGTGFGLAIVRRLVQAHDWSVAVTESATGGARFEFGDVRTVETGAR